MTDELDKYTRTLELLLQHEAKTNPDYIRKICREVDPSMPDVIIDILIRVMQQDGGVTVHPKESDQA